MIGARESGSSAAATAQFGGPNGARIDLFWALTHRVSDEQIVELMSGLFDSYQGHFMHPERTRLVASSEQPSAPTACTTLARFEGFELHYEFFPAGATLCVVEDADVALLALVAGEFNGLEGYRASDAVASIILDRMIAP